MRKFGRYSQIMVGIWLGTLVNSMMILQFKGVGYWLVKIRIWDLTVLWKFTVFWEQNNFFFLTSQYLGRYDRLKFVSPFFLNLSFSATKNPSIITKSNWWSYWPFCETSVSNPKISYIYGSYQRSCIWTSRHITGCRSKKNSIWSEMICKWLIY